MSRHATAAEPTVLSQVERLTQAALSNGYHALRKYGPDAAIAAMKPWAEALEKAERKAATRAGRR